MLTKKKMHSLKSYTQKKDQVTLNWNFGIWSQFKFISVYFKAWLPQWRGHLVPFNLKS